MPANDLVTNLRDLARLAHADLSVADEAADEIERLRRSLASAQDRAQSLETVFAHYHVRSPEDDACAECGLDLRNPVHLRVDDERLKGPKAASRTATPAAEEADHG